MKLILQKILMGCVIMHYPCSVFAMSGGELKEAFWNDLPLLVDDIEDSDSCHAEDAKTRQAIENLKAELKSNTTQTKKSEKKQLFTDLCDAAFNHDLKKVQECLKEGACIECGKKSSLHSVIDGLVSKTHQILVSDRKAEKIQKAKQEAHDMLKFLIERGANVNIRSKEGGTPLIHAGFYVQTDIVALLLEQGANKDFATESGIVAWHNAAVGSHAAACQHLPETGDPFYYILFSDEKYKEERQRCIELLKPEKESSQYENYCKFLEEEINEGKVEQLYEAALALNVDAVKQLLSEGVNFRIARRYSLLSPVYTLLVGAAHGYVEFIKNIEKENQPGIDYYSLANKAMEHSQEIARLLVNNGLDVNTVGPLGRPALAIAVASANIGLVKELLSLGAQAGLRDYLGVNAFDCADVNSKTFKENLQDKDFIVFALRYSIARGANELRDAIQSNDKKREDELWKDTESLKPYRAALKEIYSILQENQETQEKTQSQE